MAAIRSRQFQRKASSFTGEAGSLYTKLPDGRWAREKSEELMDSSPMHKAQGKLKIQQTTRFIHPDSVIQKQTNPYTGEEQEYNRLIGATSGGEDMVRDGVPYTASKIGDKYHYTPVPANHISSEPKEGWHPFEWNQDDNGTVTSVHTGHPVASVNYEGSPGYYQAGEELGA
jgi:hypothetical protein